MASFELREDGGFELREDTAFELREEGLTGAAVATVSGRPRLLCASYGVLIRDRVTGVTVARLPERGWSASFDYRIDRTSEAQLTVDVSPNGVDADCCLRLGEVGHWMHELVFYREGNNQEVWGGPITRLRDVPGRGQFIVYAKDRSAWWWRRAITRNLTYSGTAKTDAARVFMDLVREAEQTSGSASWTLPYDPVRLSLSGNETGVTVDGKVLTASDIVMCGPEIQTLSDSVIDWTVIGRRGYVGSLVLELDPLTLAQEHWLELDPEFDWDGENVATQVQVLGARGIRGEWPVGQIEFARWPQYGSHTLRVSDSKITDQATATARARSLWERNQQPILNVLSTGGSLSQFAPVTVEDLIPGRVINVGIEESCFLNDHRLAQTRENGVLQYIAYQAAPQVADTGCTEPTMSTPGQTCHVYYFGFDAVIGGAGASIESSHLGSCSGSYVKLSQVNDSFELTFTLDCQAEVDELNQVGGGGLTTGFYMVGQQFTDGADITVSVDVNGNGFTLDAMPIFATADESDPTAWALQAYNASDLASLAPFVLGVNVITFNLTDLGAADYAEFESIGFGYLFSADPPGCLDVQDSVPIAGIQVIDNGGGSRVGDGDTIVTCPTGIEVGDLLVLQIYLTGSAGSLSATPDGDWTFVDSYSATSSDTVAVYLAVYYRIADSGDVGCSSIVVPITTSNTGAIFYTNVRGGTADFTLRTLSSEPDPVSTTHTPTIPAAGPDGLYLASWWEQATVGFDGTVTSATPSSIHYIGVAESSGPGANVLWYTDCTDNASPPPTFEFEGPSDVAWISLFIPGTCAEIAGNPICLSCACNRGCCPDVIDQPGVDNSAPQVLVVAERLTKTTVTIEDSQEISVLVDLQPLGTEERARGTRHVVPTPEPPPAASCFEELVEADGALWALPLNEAETPTAAVDIVGGADWSFGTSDLGTGGHHEYEGPGLLGYCDTTCGQNWATWMDQTLYGEIISPSNAGIYELNQGDFTVEAWIYPEFNSFAKTIASQDYDTSGSWQLRLSGPDPDVTADVGYLQGWAPTVVTGPTEILPGQWYHVAMVRSGSDLFLYLNGVLEASGGGQADGVGTATNIYLCRGASFTTLYVGRMAWVVGYDVALTGAEILAHYEATC